MRVLTAGAAVLVLTTACSSGRDASRSTTEPPSTLNAVGCPATDEAFCETATRVANALASRNAGALFELSRADTIDCADVLVDYFPQCRTGDVLEGHGLSDADLIVELVSEDAYRERLDTITSGLDAAYSDELGDGGVRVIGLGTCGPDVPGRRTYHLAWTAGLSDRADASQRVLGSFEFTFDNDWRIALTYLDVLERWEAEHANPLTDSFCEAGRTPWA